MAFGEPADPEGLKAFEEAGPDEVVLFLRTAPEKEALAELAQKVLT